MRTKAEIAAEMVEVKRAIRQLRARLAILQSEPHKDVYVGRLEQLCKLLMQYPSGLKTIDIARYLRLTYPQAFALVRRACIEDVVYQLDGKGPYLVRADAVTASLRQVMPGQEITYEVPTLVEDTSDIIIGVAAASAMARR